jgi:hypothetical protein
LRDRVSFFSNFIGGSLRVTVRRGQDSTSPVNGRERERLVVVGSCARDYHGD